jgi:peptidoglycan/LPS O-acetylase OafA/YrhL
VVGVAETAVARGRHRSAGPDGGGRLTELDGLRGLAALVVVVHHALLTWPVLAAQYFGVNRATGSWWLTYTPLHLAWAGTEAVMVFFVLSGLVLALPYLRAPNGPARWRGYYGQRLIRLYLPVLAALAVAAVLVAAFPRVPGPATSWWFAAHAVPVTAGTLIRDALLLGGVSWIDAPLWSLRYEVLFSLLLPAYVLLGRRLRHRPGCVVAGALLLSGLGTYLGSAALTWLPVFAVGVAMAAARTRLQSLGLRLAGGRRPVAAWSLLAALAVLLLLAEWEMRGLGRSGPLALAVARSLGVAGAALVCFLVLACPAVGALCRWGPVRRLGTVSFSLYLVHEPVVVSVSSVVGGSLRGVAGTLVVGTAVSLALAAVFHRLVEAPSARLARAVGRRLQGRPAVAGARPAGAPRPARAAVGHPAVGHPIAVPRPRAVHPVTRPMALPPGPPRTEPRRAAAEASPAR